MLLNLVRFFFNDKIFCTFLVNKSTLHLNNCYGFIIIKYSESLMFQKIHWDKIATDFLKLDKY